jgi:PAS domain S-box-containing protein
MLRLNLKLSHKGLILVSVPLIFELIFLATLTALLRQAEIEVQRQVRSKAIISQANTLSKLFYDAGVAMGGYSITKSPLFSDRYDKIVRQIPQDLNELKSLVGDNPRQQQILQNLAVITVTGLKILGEAKSAIDDNRVDVAQFRARHMYKEIRSLADKLQDELRGLTEDERKIESEGPEAQNRSRATVKLFLVVGVVFNVLLAVALALFFSRGIGKRLNVLTDNTIRLARGEPLNEPLVGMDEIAHLDGVFHSMADALTEASRKERAIIENAADVICSVDVDGKFVAVSPACMQVWGYRPDELMGRRFIELIIPEDHQETIRAVRAVRAEKGTTTFENRTRKKDGSVITVEWSAYWSETERSMFCVAHDITERKLAEEVIKASERRIRTIIENMLVGLVIFTKDGTIESINPSSERMFGYRAEELVGKHIMSLFHDSTLFSVNNPNDRRNFMENLFQKSLNRVGEFDALKKMGEDFPIELSLSELETAEGARYLANVLDVSERREVERLKKEFVSTVSHELRTPLTSIRGSLTLLNVGALGGLPEQAKKVVGIAERNTIRLITLINDILDIEKLESGKLDMVFDTVNMSNVLDRSAEAVRAFAEQNGIRLEMMPTTASVYADGDRLVQVLVNLVSNAVKFSPKGAAVTIVVQEVPNWVEVQVIDRGRGIPAKYKNLLFQRFQQVEASDSRKKGGTGLGLAICKGIIEAHGGNIGVESEEGKGSVFWFRIPPAQPKGQVPPQLQAHTIPSGAMPQGQSASPQQPQPPQSAMLQLTPQPPAVPAGNPPPPQPGFPQATTQQQQQMMQQPAAQQPPQPPQNPPQRQEEKLIG